MQRAAEQHLKKWIETDQRKPLVIRGARQVGKSTLVRQFAEKNKLLLNEINLEQHLELNNIFKTLDTRLISKELEGLLGRKIISPGSILFLDEIVNRALRFETVEEAHASRSPVPPSSDRSLGPSSTRHRHTRCSSHRANGRARLPS